MDVKNLGEIFLLLILKIILIVLQQIFLCVLTLVMDKLTYANGGSGNLYYSIDGGNAFVSIDTFPDQCPGLFNIVVQDDSGCDVNANNQLLEPTDIQTTINITHPGCLGSNDGEVDFKSLVERLVILTHGMELQ